MRAPILITGATGAQGGATAREMLKRGFAVRVLTRKPDAPHARELARLGAEIFPGDFEQVDSLARGLNGAHGVFSMQIPDMTGTDSERRHGLALVEAARRARVSQFVHTSVTGTGDHVRFPRWGSGHWNEKYWTDKWDIEEAVRAARFDAWTVLKPAFLMDNFAQPKARYMFPDLARGEIATALKATTRMQLIAADDVGAFAAAAFDEPSRFHGQNVDLAAEALTTAEVATILSRELGARVTAHELTSDEALQRGQSAGWVRSQEWSNEVGYRADIAALARHDIPLTRFEAWVHRHRERITIAAAPG